MFPIFLRLQILKQHTVSHGLTLKMILQHCNWLFFQARQNLGTVLGKKGAEADYVVNLLRCRQIVDEQWNTTKS